MTHDTLIYKCDDGSCYWNYGQMCTSVQISLDENHGCIVYILRELAEEAILVNMEAKRK